MKTTWRLIGLYAILAAALTAYPAVAGDNTSDEQKAKDLADIQKKLDRIETSLNKLQGLKVDVDELREKMKFQRSVEMTGMEQEILNLQKQMVRLTEEIAQLRTPAASPRTAFYAGPGSAPPAAATGTIRLRSTYPEPVTIAINGRVYDVAPGAEVAVPQPAGDFTYEVLGIQPPVRRTLVANRTFSIDVFPR